ncbi:MAG TPA: type III-A CRISPR-associated protein Csm2, partial [Chloroflexi bacterium]|nr:type III-A CRISPR-associated protein Csm2 [Chloroflexota bacterium]
GSSLARQQLTTNQIRAIFGEVRRIEGDWKIDPKRANKNLILLKPKMAYRAKKEQRSRGVGELVSVLDPAINLVAGKQKNFTRFVEFFEAILAYHKAAGGN